MTEPKDGVATIVACSMRLVGYDPLRGMVEITEAVVVTRKTCDSPADMCRIAILSLLTSLDCSTVVLPTAIFPKRRHTQLTFKVNSIN